MAGQEVVRQLEDVVAPDAQRRHDDLEAAQPVIEVGAEHPAIGQAGENLVPMSVVMNSYSHSAGGVGAVMGSKGVKAVVLDDTGMKMRSPKDPSGAWTTKTTAWSAPRTT